MTVEEATLITTEFASFCSGYAASSSAVSASIKATSEAGGADTSETNSPDCLDSSRQLGVGSAVGSTMGSAHVAHTLQDTLRTELSKLGVFHAVLAEGIRKLPFNGEDGGENDSVWSEDEDSVCGCGCGVDLGEIPLQKEMKRKFAGAT